MSYELSGKIKLIQDEQQFNSGFRKRELVVTVEDGKYSQDILLEFVQDKIALLDGLKVGQAVNVSFNIRGREYNGRYFNNLTAWKISAVDAQPEASSGKAWPSAPAATSAWDNDEPPF